MKFFKRMVRKTGNVVKKVSPVSVYVGKYVAKEVAKNPTMPLVSVFSPSSMFAKSFMKPKSVAPIPTPVASPIASPQTQYADAQYSQPVFAPTPVEMPAQDNSKLLMIGGAAIIALLLLRGKK
jgi:hypothetical protein